MSEGSKYHGCFTSLPLIMVATCTHTHTHTNTHVMIKGRDKGDAMEGGVMRDAMRDMTAA